MISERIKCDSLFENPTSIKINIWKSIAKKLNSKFGNKVFLTDQLCERKWRNLWQTYKDNVIKSKNTDSEVIIWDYYNEIDDYFGSKDNVKITTQNDHVSVIILSNNNINMSSNQSDSPPAKDIKHITSKVTQKSPIKPFRKNV